MKPPGLAIPAAIYTGVPRGPVRKCPEEGLLSDFGRLAWSAQRVLSECFSAKNLGAKKPINRKHINIFLTALVGQSSQGRTPTRPRDKRDKMAILQWNSTEKGRFVPGTGPILSRGGVPSVPGTVPVCPGHRPAENVYVYWFFSCPKNTLRDTPSPAPKITQKARFGALSRLGPWALATLGQ